MLKVTITWIKKSLQEFWNRYFSFNTQTSCATFWLDIIMYLFICPKILTIFPAILYFYYGIIILPMFTLFCRRWNDAGVSDLMILVSCAVIFMLFSYNLYFPRGPFIRIAEWIVLIIIGIIGILISISPKNKAPMVLAFCYHHLISLLSDIITMLINSFKYVKRII